MIKSLFIFIVVFATSACNSAPEKYPSEVDSVTNQHVGALQVSAEYYCANGKWPLSVQEIKDFQSEKSIDLPVKLNWLWLGGENVRVFSDGAKMGIESRAGEIGGDVIMARSWQKVPVCNTKGAKTVGAAIKFVRQ